MWVTVDDFGLSPRANREIVALAERGVLTAVSVMVHGSACTDGLAELLATPVRIGLHATFTDGVALSPRLGRLPRAWWSLAPSSIGRARGAFAEELREQAERLFDLAGRVDFVNSHEHVHLLPWLWPAVAELVLRREIAAVRAPGWPPASSRGPEAAMACVAALAQRRALLPRSTTRTAPLGVLRAGRLDPPGIRELLTRHRHGAQPLELCCHPVTSRGTTPESALLASGAVDRILEDFALVREGANELI